MKYILPRGFLSASAISMLQKCPKQYEFRYIRNIVIPPNAALSVGSMAHKTLETYYRDAMTTTNRLTPAQVAELAADTFKEWLEDNETSMSSVETDEARTVLPTMLQVYVDKIGQFITPVAIEREIHFTSAGGVPLLGYLDLQFAKQDGGVGIADYKVTSRKLDRNSLVNSLQFNLYALMTGIGDIQIHNLVKTEKHSVSRKTNTVEGVTDYTTGLRVLHHYFDGTQVSHFEYLIESAARLITSGIFMPCAPDAWCCNSEWCGYWHLCRGRL